MQNSLAMAVLLVGIASPALAAEPMTLACAPPFTKEMTAETLAGLFGGENLHTGPLMGPEGEFYEATVIYPDELRKQLIVAWIDEAAHARPDSIAVRGESNWIGPEGLSLGMGLEEVQRLNGERFEVYGFGWDYGGLAELQSGKLATLAGPCQIRLTFEPAPDGMLEDVIGETLFWSDDPKMRNAGPRLSAIELRFRQEVE